MPPTPGGPIRLPAGPAARALPVAALVLATVAGCGGDDAPRTPSSATSSVPAAQSPVPGLSPAPTAASSPAPAVTLPGATVSPTVRPPSRTAVPDDPLAPRPALESPPPVGVPPCAPADLTLTDADTVYGAQVVRELFTVRTTGPDCQLPAAAPAAQLLLEGSAAPRALPQGGLDLPAPAPGPLTLSRSTSLSLFVATLRDGPCVPATTLVVTLAGTAQALRATTAMQVCGDQVAVGPLQRLGDDE